MMSVKIGFIGAGNMAEAIARGLVEKNVVSSSGLLLSDPSDVRRDYFEKLGLRTTTDNAALIRASDVVILAVKPQVMGAVLEPLRGEWKPNQLGICIAAGIQTAKLDVWCGGVPAIIRVMPNTPALVGQGVSAICAGPRVKSEQLELAGKLFASVGHVLHVEESAMDAVTAISGSGPAYVFYWLEAMLAAAREQGFDDGTARTLVYETLAGAAELARSSSDTPDVLRARVTSKGGTTEAAIRTLDEQNVNTAIVEAVRAATKRSRELSN